MYVIPHNTGRWEGSVKPNENITCPGDPCMTLGAYIEASDMYFVSDTSFTFLPGELYYDGNLRLSNITDILLQGEDIVTVERNFVQIIFMPGSNLTFISSGNIALKNLSILLSGSQTAFDNPYNFFASTFLQNSSVQLSNIAVVGSNSNFYSTAFFGRQCYIEVTNIQITQARSVSGAALNVFNNSTVTLSGSNTFNYNQAAIVGGAIYSADSIINFSGRNHFEGNSAGLVGGAISSTNTEFNISGEAVFLRNISGQLRTGTLISECIL